MAKDRTDREIVQATAKEYRRRADEAFQTYQETGIGRYDTQFHKYDALANALESDSLALKQESAQYRVKLSEFCSRAASIQYAPEDLRLKRADELLRDMTFWAKLEGLISNR